MDFLRNPDKDLSKFKSDNDVVDYAKKITDNMANYDTIKFD